MKNGIYFFIKFLVKLGLYAYHKKIEVHGPEHVPKDKPVLFLPNHQSALLDVLLIVVDCNRKPFFLTRADVFGKPFLNTIFEFFRMIPIYRMRDGKDTLTKNDLIFSKCADILNNRDALVMFPEANHSLKRRVRPLSKGFTRILFKTIDKYPDLDIQLVPVGLNYKDAEGFPDEVAIYYGKPIALHSILDRTDFNASAKTIKNLVSDRLKNLTTHIEAEDTYEKVIHYLNEKNVDYLRPKLVNKLISEYVPSVTKETMHNLKGKRISFLYPLFVLLNLPIILVWRFMVKPKVWEPEFIGTLRFATALLGFSFYYSGLFIALTFLNGAGFALAAILILFIFNWVYIKYA